MSTCSEKHFIWLRSPEGKLLERAKRTRLDTLLVERPRPNTPLLNELAVLRLLLALVVAVEELVVKGTLVLIQSSVTDPDPFHETPISEKKIKENLHQNHKNIVPNLPYE